MMQLANTSMPAAVQKQPHPYDIDTFQKHLQLIMAEILVKREAFLTTILVREAQVTSTTSPRCATQIVAFLKQRTNWLLLRKNKASGPVDGLSLETVPLYFCKIRKLSSTGCAQSSKKTQFWQNCKTGPGAYREIFW